MFAFALPRCGSWLVSLGRLKPACWGFAPVPSGGAAPTPLPGSSPPGPRAAARLIGASRFFHYSFFFILYLLYHCHHDGDIVVLVGRTAIDGTPQQKTGEGLGRFPGVLLQ